MNKIILFTFFVGIVTFTSCQKEYEMDFTQAGLMAGQWIVSGDPYLDHWTLNTANSENDDPGKLLLTDGGDFWEFTVTVDANTSGLTFGQTTPVVNQWYNVAVKDPVIRPYDIEVIVKNGKIERNAVLLPSGTMADKITFTLAFEDDDFEEWTMVGYRYSGFVEDDNYVYTE